MLAKHQAAWAPGAGVPCWKESEHYSSPYFFPLSPYGEESIVCTWRFQLKTPERPHTAASKAIAFPESSPSPPIPSRLLPSASGHNTIQGSGFWKGLFQITDWLFQSSFGRPHQSPLSSTGFPGSPHFQNILNSKEEGLVGVGV